MTATAGRTGRRASAALLAAALVIGLGACGDDDDGEAGGTDAAGLADDEGGSEEFCAAAAAVDAANLEAEDPTSADVDAALQEAVDTAPSALAADVELMVDEAREMNAAPQTDGPPPMPSPEFYDSAVRVGDHLTENCDFGSVSVTAADYSFSGVPAEVPAGTTVFSFENGGTEFHEIALMHVADGEERPVEELLALPEEEVSAVATEAAFVLAPPGAANFVTAELEPGRYVAVCFVPIGATPDALASGAELAGEPHAMHGMVAEFTVT